MLQFHLKLPQKTKIICCCCVICYILWSPTKNISGGLKFWNCFLLKTLIIKVIIFILLGVTTPAGVKSLWQRNYYFEEKKNSLAHLKKREVSALCVCMNILPFLFFFPHFLIFFPHCMNLVWEKEWSCFTSVTSELASIKRI